MRRRRARTRTALALLLLALLASACGEAAVPTAAPAATDVPPVAAVPSTPTPDLVTPEVIGRSFFEAWNAEDYARMYSLTAPAVQAAVTQEAFAQSYRAALHTTTAISLTLLPRSLSVDGETAWIEFQETWHTGMFGALQATNTLDLVQVDNAWYVDWTRAAIWPDLADGNAFAIEYQIPARANIYDRNGAGLAIPTTIVTVGVIPDRIEDETVLLATLSQALGLTQQEIQQAYAGQPGNWFIPITDITGEESLTLNEQLSLPGIERRERAGRLYPLNGVASHVVGWVSPIPAEHADAYRQQGYRADQRVGVAGLEAWGESILAGQNGGRLSLTAEDNSYVGKLAERPAKRGRPIYTTIDRDLQHQAELMLGGRPGAVVAVDVNTGAVLAMTSGPGFDSNVFVRSTEEWQRMAVLNDPNQPLVNRAIQGQYPAGSVFKIVTLAAALGAGNLSPETTFNCPGYWDGLGEANRKMCWLETGHGELSLRNGLTASCNVVFYNAGTALHNASPGALSEFGAAFGFGEATGLATLSEADGLMPGPAWKESVYQAGWSVGDTVNLSIGQGYLLVTPLQIARMVASVANGGTLYRPYLIERIAAGEAGEPEEVTRPNAVGQLPVSGNHLAIIQDAMLGVTTNPSIGTATHRFRGLDVAVAGKTGTAETARETDQPHSWFAGYFPADAPEIAMVVLVEHAGEGSTVAAPMFRQVVEGYYGLPITPLPTPTPPPVEE
jgi:penicillin-binding protein 2